MGRPLAIDLFTGLHGWAEGLVAEGFRVIGYDIEDMCAQFNKPRPDHVELVLQDILTIHGSQFTDAELIVASPPCQEYSYMAMPWKLAKAKAAAIRADTTGAEMERLNRLFNACFRIQREACEAVRGAIPWVGRSRYNFGSFHLWGDVPALMPAGRAIKVPSFRFDGNGSFQSASIRRTNPCKGARFTSRDCGNERLHAVDHETGVKIGGDWFSDPTSTCRREGSKSKGRKAASAMIAKIPEPLSRHIGRVFLPGRQAA